eukprot:m.764253 g.764253  ORF g.764253 m.764253 type:complete len:95 (+) comp23214_c0_seq3:466-750(+)
MSANFGVSANFGAQSMHRNQTGHCWGMPAFTQSVVRAGGAGADWACVSSSSQYMNGAHASLALRFHTQSWTYLYVSGNVAELPSMRVIPVNATW